MEGQGQSLLFSNYLENKFDLGHLNKNEEDLELSGSFHQKFLKKKIEKSSHKTRKRPKRGRYRKYTYSLKKEAVELSIKLGDPLQASKIMNVPLKNLRRWIENGPRRKKGGRKTHDPQMEVKLYNWIDNFRKLNDEMPSRKEIKTTALRFSRYPQKFKASKGWYEKFMLRHFSKKKKESYSEEWEDLKKRILKENNLDFKEESVEKITLTKCEKNKVQDKVYSVWEGFVSGKSEEPIGQLRVHIQNVLNSMLRNKSKKDSLNNDTLKKKPNFHGLSYLLDRGQAYSSSVSSDGSMIPISDEENLRDSGMQVANFKDESNLFSDPFLNQPMAKIEELNNFQNESKLISSDKMSMNHPRGISLLEKNSNITQNGLFKGMLDHFPSDNGNLNQLSSSESRYPLVINNLTESNENRMETQTQKTKKLYSPKLTQKMSRNHLKKEIAESGVFGGLEFKSINNIGDKKYVFGLFNLKDLSFSGAEKKGKLFGF